MERRELHVRQMKIAAYEIGPNRIAVAGHLDDTTPIDFVNVDGRVLEAGLIHDINAEMEITLPEMTITAVTASLTKVPDDECRDVVSSLNVLVGLSVRRGYSSTVKRLLQGTHCCTHLVNLLVAMGPIALRGSSMAMQNAPIEQRRDRATKHLVNSCYHWREDGARVRALRGHWAD